MCILFRVVDQKHQMRKIITTWLDREQETTYIVINCSHNHSSNHQKPVGHWDINLAVEVLAGVDHFDMRKVAQSHNLREKLKAACYHCLRSHYCRQDCNDERWVEHSRRYRVEKGVRICSLCDILADIGGLPNICKEEAWVGEADPRELNCPIRTQR